MEHEARLWAVESLTVNLLVIVSGFLSDRDALLRSVFDQMAESARHRPMADLPESTFPKELEAAIRRLREMAEQQIAGYPMS